METESEPSEQPSKMSQESSNWINRTLGGDQNFYAKVEMKLCLRYVTIMFACDKLVIEICSLKAMRIRKLRSDTREKNSDWENRDSRMVFKEGMWIKIKKHQNSTGTQI